MGVKGLNTYTISNDKNSVEEWIVRLDENSIKGKQWYDPGKVKFGFWCKMCTYPVLRQQS
jgi:hypothetical protein